MIRVGDYVTRNSYNNDIIFKVNDIKGNVCYLKGVCVRLYADSYIDDLKKYDGDVEDDFDVNFTEYDSLDRNEYFYLPGKILHLDGDIVFIWVHYMVCEGTCVQYAGEGGSIIFVPCIVYT